MSTAPNRLKTHDDFLNSDLEGFEGHKAAALEILEKVLQASLEDGDTHALDSYLDSPSALGYKYAHQGVDIEEAQKILGRLVAAGVFRRNNEAGAFEVAPKGLDIARALFVQIKSGQIREEIAHAVSLKVGESLGREVLMTIQNLAPKSGLGD